MKRVLALCAAAAALTGCAGSSGSSASPPPSHDTVTTPASYSSRAGCDRTLLPAGYHADPAHSGVVTAHSYSAAAEVQAALLYDKLQAGSRQVYLLGQPKHATAVVSCISLRFPGSDELGRFFGSYQSLRHQAGSVVTKLPARPVAGVTGPVAYDEADQSFRGYGIASTHVTEVAGTTGNSLLIASVSGVHPSRALAARLLASMVSDS